MATYPTRWHVDPKRLDRACTTQKVCFDTRQAALDAAELQMLQGKVERGCHIMPYRCNTCGQWHVANRQIVPVGRSTFQTSETKRHG